MKYEIKNRYTGTVQATAEIECDEKESESIKLGLAVKWAIENNASLVSTNLDRANLDRANLAYSNLAGASLFGANLNGANLNSASLVGASLACTNLNYTNIAYANLNGASLDHANLNGASLYRANLNGANFAKSRLTNTGLFGVTGINQYVKSVHLEQYPIAYTSEVIQIGCEQHKISEWETFSDKRISEMDGKNALTWWRKYKGLLFETIAICPAKPTQETEE